MMRATSPLRPAIVALLALLHTAASGEEPPPQQCAGAQCGAATVYGTEFVYGSHTVILAEGSEAELQDPGWSGSFGMQHIAEDDTCATMGWQTRAEPRRVWDAFTFFNELDVLRLRLRTLAPVVHRFVLAEATRTHSNQPKALVFEQAKSDPEIARLLPRIEHIVVEDLPDSADSWELEHFQRNALVRGLAGAEDDDLVIVGDCDEVPSPHAVDLLRWCDGWDDTGPVQFYTRFYNFKFEFQFEALWYHPQAATVKWLSGPKGRGSPERLRFARTRPSHLRLEDAGWHLSFFADTRGVVAKIKAYAHQEFNRGDMLNETAIAEAIAQGSDYFYAHGKGEERFGKLHRASCHGLPRHVLQNPLAYQSWLPADGCETV
jgi:beta-1,4-mannosyl-glycoprotein beta-1,4-N-acetylglucosaminyltransferase